MLPNAWVEEIFSRLSVRYGSTWLALWNGLDMGAVKADWAEVLSGYAQAPGAIKHGLSHLPTDRPPTASQFAALCRNAPRYAPVSLPAPVVDHAISAAVKAAHHPKIGTAAKAWAHALRKREQAGERLTSFQRTAWRDARQCDVADVQDPSVGA